MEKIRGKYLNAYLQNINSDSEEIKIKNIRKLEINYALTTVTAIILLGLFAITRNIH